MQNIDIYAAELGQMIATNMVRNDEKEKEKQSKNIRQAENHVTKSLGVLQENGLYAFFLYQKVEYKSGGEIVLKYCHDLLGKEPYVLLKPGQELYGALRLLCSDLNSLFFAKELVERVLIYARYHLKARLENVMDKGGDNV